MITIISILIFILGGTVGAFITLFISATGKCNKEQEYYQEGFIDGYNKAQKEKEKG